jgi:putative nucleotidyltransferase with HDIG domain
MMGSAPNPNQDHPPMFASSLILGEALANRCAQVLYRCLEEVGSTKGALYLRAPETGGFEVVSFYGWPRGTRPPVAIPPGHPLLVQAQRVRRSFVVNEASELPELAAFGQGGEWPRFLITPVYLAGDWVGLLIQRDRIKGGTFDVDRDGPPTVAICGDLIHALREFRLYGAAPLPEPLPLSPQGPGPQVPPSVLAPGVVPEDLPTASSVIDEVAPVAEHLLSSGAVTSTPALAPEFRVLSSGPLAQERMYGYAEGQSGFAALPWEADRTLSSWVAPIPVNPERKRGMVPPEQRAFFWEIAGLLSEILSASAVALWIEDPEEIRPILAYSTLPLSAALQQQILSQAALHLPAVQEQDLRLVTRAAMPESPELEGAFATFLPLLLNEAPQGHDLMLVFRQEDQPFSMSETQAILQLGRILGLHMQEARLHERYYHAFLSVSHRILQSSEARLPSLRPHSLATARLARDLALRLELSTEEVEAVSIAAILHDVGLLLLDPTMLNKADMNSEDLRKIRSHPELASVFLKDLRFPFEVVKMIRHHHERWDGRGYPEGLKGADIPIGSRIIGLIEAYEVMTSGKGYRPPMSLRQVEAELQNEAGSQFDPDIVEAFSELMARKGERK